MYVCMYVCVCVYIYGVFTCSPYDAPVYMYVYVCVCIYVCVCMYVYVCMYVCVCMYVFSPAPHMMLPSMSSKESSLSTPVDSMVCGKNMNVCIEMVSLIGMLVLRYVSIGFNR
jgi:hypothetical protein